MKDLIVVNAVDQLNEKHLIEAEPDCKIEVNVSTEFEAKLSPSGQAILLRSSDVEIAIWVSEEQEDFITDEEYENKTWHYITDTQISDRLVQYCTDKLYIIIEDLKKQLVF